MATKQRRVTLAFAGPGETTLENAKALLNDFLGFGPEDADGFPETPEEDELDLRIVIPATEEHLTDGMFTIIDWLDYADLAYDAITDKSTASSRGLRKVLKNAEQSDAERNVNDALVGALRDDQEDGAEVYLVLLWGEDGDENAEVLLDLASSHEIRALDLTAGLDDLDFGEEATPVPEPEPEPEKPTRRRRTPEAPKDPEPDLEGQVASARRTRKKTEPKPEPDLETTAAQARAQKQLEAINQERPVDLVVRLAREFAAALDGIGEDTREKTLAKERIEEGMLWALAHITRHVEGPHFAPGGVLSPAQPEKAPEEPKKPATRRRTTKAAAPDPEPANEPEKAPAAPARGRGRPRKDGTPAQPRGPEDRAVMEIWDEDEQSWVPKGRGRAPKGIPTRLVDPKTGDVLSESA